MPLACLLARSLTVFTLLIFTPAQAEVRPSCAPRDRVVEQLAERYGETLRSMGLNRDEGLIEVYASEDTGSWTILLTLPDGQTCLIASGEWWQADAAPFRKPGQDV